MAVLHEHFGNLPVAEALKIKHIKVIPKTLRKKVNSMNADKLDLVVSFDTTGSMYPVLGQVRSKVEKFIDDIFSSYNDLRLAIIAHGDYCDAGKPYTIRIRDFTTDKKELAKFVRETDKTFGGDADECYELVLNSLTEQLHWRPDAAKIAIVIGDAAPHSPSYFGNKKHLDWKVETNKVYKEGIKIFAVHALAAYRSSSKGFYQTIANETNGVYLTLDQFSDIVEIINATVCQQAGEEKLDEYISIIRDKGSLTKSLDNNFRRLKGEKVEDDYSYAVDYSYSSRSHSSKTRKPREAGAIKEMDELVPVIPGRFQTLTVDVDTPIKQFVEKYGADGVFEKGRGFYELTKAETVQQYKEVIMQNRETGEMFTGTQVREKLHLSPQTESGGVNEKLHKSDASEFRIFVQSTSVNRKLIAGTTFLYDLGDMEDTGTYITSEPTSDKSSEVPEPVAEPVAEPKPAKSTKKKTKAPKKAASTPEPKPESPAKSGDAEVKKMVDELVEKLLPPVPDKTPDTEPKAVAKPKASKKSAKKVKVETLDTPKPVDESSKTPVSTKPAIEKAPVLDEKFMEKATLQLDKTKDALERLAKSRNKKNKEFAKNNLTKMISYLTDVLNEIE
jgi:hypothetical protein